MVGGRGRRGQLFRPSLNFPVLVHLPVGWTTVSVGAAAVASELVGAVGLTTRNRNILRAGIV